MTPSSHACAVLVGADGVLIRGPSGAGKSRLALALLDEARAAGRFARLVSDDRVCLEIHHGRLIATAPARTAGLIEQRGLGIRTVAHEPEAVIALIVDIVAEESLQRLPERAEISARSGDPALPRLAVPADPRAAVGLVLAALETLREGGPSAAVTDR